MDGSVPSRLASLVHLQRLAVCRLLMRRYPVRVPDGETADALGLKPGTLSTHLSALLRAGLVSQTRISASLRHAFDMAEMRRTFGVLLLDFRRGRPEVCAPISFPFAQGPQIMSDRAFRALFNCTRISTNSIIAVSLLRKEDGDRFDELSAERRLSSELNSSAREVLAQKGLDNSVSRAKNTAEFKRPDAPQFDLVFTVCNRTATEEYPAGTGQHYSAHGSMPDPAKVDGTDARKSLVFQKASRVLRDRIKVFPSLPIALLDRIALNRAVNETFRTDIGAHA